jgi:hypothetical protein
MPDDIQDQNGPARVCNGGSCAEVERLASGDVRMTSSIEGNDGAVTYTSGEWGDFLTAAKDGKWDFI